MTARFEVECPTQRNDILDSDSIADHKGNDLHATQCDRDRLAAAFSMLITFVLSRRPSLTKVVLFIQPHRIYE